MGSGILNEEKWSTMPFVEQMANIGSEVGRTSKWVQKNKPNMAESAFSGTECFPQQPYGKEDIYREYL